MSKKSKKNKFFTNTRIFTALLLLLFLLIGIQAYAIRRDGDNKQLVYYEDTVNTCKGLMTGVNPQPEDIKRHIVLRKNLNKFLENAEEKGLCIYQDEAATQLLQKEK